MCVLGLGRHWLTSMAVPLHSQTGIPRRCRGGGRNCLGFSLWNDRFLPFMPCSGLAPPLPFPLLTLQLSVPVLEGVRKIKATMNKLISRAQRLKQEMEEILEDDDDMAVRGGGTFTSHTPPSFGRVWGSMALRLRGLASTCGHLRALESIVRLADASDGLLPIPTLPLPTPPPPNNPFRAAFFRTCIWPGGRGIGGRSCRRSPGKSPARPETCCSGAGPAPSRGWCRCFSLKRQTPWHESPAPAPTPPPSDC